MTRKPRQTGDNEIGRLVRTARKAQRLSQIKLADLTGYSRSWIVALENAPQPPNISADLAHRLHAILGIPLDVLPPDGRPGTFGTVAVADLDSVSTELRELVEMVLRLQVPSDDIRTAQDLLYSMHLRRQEREKRIASKETTSDDGNATESVDWTRAEAGAVRDRLESFAEDWNAPGMAAYDTVDLTPTAVARGAEADADFAAGRHKVFDDVERFLADLDA